MHEMSSKVMISYCFVWVNLLLVVLGREQELMHPFRCWECQISCRADPGSIAPESHLLHDSCAPCVHNVVTDTKGCMARKSRADERLVFRRCGKTPLLLHDAWFRSFCWCAHSPHTIHRPESRRTAIAIAPHNHFGHRLSLSLPVLACARNYYRNSGNTPPSEYAR